MSGFVLPKFGAFYREELPRLMGKPEVREAMEARDAKLLEINARYQREITPHFEEHSKTTVPLYQAINEADAKLAKARDALREQYSPENDAAHREFITFCKQLSNG